MHTDSSLRYTKPILLGLSPDLQCARWLWACGRDGNIKTFDTEPRVRKQVQRPTPGSTPPAVHASLPPSKRRIPEKGTAQNGRAPRDFRSSIYGMVVEIDLDSRTYCGNLL